MHRLVRGAWAVALVCAATLAHAGGPLGICYMKPVKYPGAGTITLNYDRGNLGSRTKAQADAIVTNAVSLWTNVGTSTVTLSRGTDLAADVTTANVNTYYGNFSDGLNPVIYDTDGSIVDLLLGVGAKSSVLGFAGSAWYDYGSYCEYAEGRAVISGFLSVSDASLGIVIAHEVGHLIGLDHTQLDSVQGLATSNFPLMYPIAYRSTATLHEDDAAAVSALYPATTLTASYGQLTGTLKQANGVAVRGANVWAQGSAGTFSIVSDYLAQNTGNFSLLLPPGTYTLHAEAISTEFNGGSSVGPYSETLSGASFQAPLYIGGVAMSPVTLGNSAPTQITITAGCAGTVAFRLDGTGSVGGNCSGTRSNMTSPAPGSMLASSSVTFTWDAGSGVTERYLAVGTSPGASDIYGGYQGSALSRTVSGLPTNGLTVYVRLMSWVSGAWQTASYTYTAASASGGTTTWSRITSPTPGSTLASSSVAFTWDAGSGVTERYLAVGTAPGGSQIYGGYQGSALSVTVPGLPTNGSTVYVRLLSWVGGAWQTYDAFYTASSSGAPAPAKSSITSPAPRSTLASSSVTFAWDTGSGVTERYLAIGTTVGGSQIYGGYQGSALSRTVSGLPTDGSTVYVRLMSWVSGAWQTNDYTYTASSSGGGAPAKSSIGSPTPGSTLASSTVTFTWDAGSGVTERYLAVGSTPGGGQYYGGYQGSALSRTVTGLPVDGSVVYVRLMSWINGGWQSSDYTYTAFH